MTRSPIELFWTAKKAGEFAIVSSLSKQYLESWLQSKSSKKSKWPILRIAFRCFAATHSQSTIPLCLDLLIVEVRWKHLMRNVLVTICFYLDYFCYKEL